MRRCNFPQKFMQSYKKSFDLQLYVFGFDCFAEEFCGECVKPRGFGCGQKLYWWRGVSGVCS